MKFNYNNITFLRLIYQVYGVKCFLMQQRYTRCGSKRNVRKIFTLLLNDFRCIYINIWKTDGCFRELIRVDREKSLALYETLLFQWNK